MNKEKVIILGGSGFIGKALDQQLSQSGVPVLGFSSKDIDLAMSNSSNLLTQFLTKKSQLIIAAAINRELGDNLETMQQNITMITNVAKYLKDYQIDHCIYLSTADIYGHHIQPITEESPVNPQTYYAISKYTGESILRLACQGSSTPLLIVRFNGIFGPGQRSSKYGPNFFIDSIVNKKQVQLWGDGKELRDTLYVKDLVMTLLCLRKKHATGLYNIATGQSSNFWQMVKILQKVVPYKFTTLYRKRTSPSFDQIFDIEKLSRSLPSLQFTPIDQAIRETFDWFIQTNNKS